MRRFLSFIGVVLILTASSALAQYQWSGAGADRSWATAGNWTNPAAPPAQMTNRILFATAGFGSNTLDQGRSVFGAAEVLTSGLHYRSPSSARLSHTTDLQGFTLKLDGGSLMVGQSSGTSSAVIANGTLQLGGSNRTAVHVGYLDNTVTTAFNNSNRLTVTATLQAVRIGDLTVGYMVSGTSGRVPQGILDLTGATLASPLGANTFKVEGALRVGQSSAFGSTTSTWSQLLFPASLTSLEAGSLLVGAGVYRAWGWVDFGSGSQLTNLWVIGEMRVGTESAYASLAPMTNLTQFRHGSVTAAVLRVGYNGTDATPVPYPTTTVVMAGGAVVGNWSEICVGMGGTGNGGFTEGRLDWSGMTTIHSGALSNSLVTPLLRVGYKNTIPEAASGGCWGRGFLLIPSNVVRIAVGEFSVGRNNNTQGWLDIGSNSALRELTVTNGFYIGAGDGKIGYTSGTNMIQAFPTGLTFRLGSAAVPIRCAIACRANNQHQNYGEAYQADVLLAPSNAVFAGYFTSFRIGCKEKSDKKAVGRLDLRNAQVDAFRVTDEAFIATIKGTAWSSSIPATNENGKGYLTLPDCDAEVYTNLHVGDYGIGSTGVLELVGGRVRVGRTTTVYPTGRITTRVRGKSAGLIMGRNNTNDLLIMAARGMQVVVEQVPDDASTPCYGLRMPGSNTVFFTGLTNSGKVRLDISALPAGYTNLAGVFYNSTEDYTYLGIQAAGPRIENGLAVPGAGTATLNGRLIDPGAAPVGVAVYWGPADGGPVASNLWAFTNDVPGTWTANSTPSLGVSLPGGSDWYAYRFVATNEFGLNQAPTSSWFMLGAVSVTATDDQASEIGPDPGTFTISRDAGMTNQAVLVAFQYGGTATPGSDYTVVPAGGTVLLGAGVASAAITVTPLYYPNGEPTETVLFQLQPGPYLVGTETATVYIADSGLSTNITTSNCGPWTGYGNGDEWGEAANWLSNTIPALVYTGKLVFGEADLGNRNLVETDRRLVGPVGSTNHGLRYQYDDPNLEKGTHLTDLGGYRLTLDGGSLMVGDQMRGTRVTITNGVLRLGGDSNAVSVYVGYLAGVTPVSYTGNLLRLACTVELARATNVFLGDIASYNSASQDRTAQGSLDCRDATFVSPLGTHVFQLPGTLGIGHSEAGRNQYYETSMMTLPASLRSLDVGTLSIGSGMRSVGLLDFGPGSQVTSIVVRSRLHMGLDAGMATIQNLPASLAWQIGSPETPGSIRIGSMLSSVGVAQAFVPQLTFPSGSISATLAELLVAWESAGNDTPISARLDMRAPALSIGGENCLKVDNLKVGFKQLNGVPTPGYGNGWGDGYLQISPAVTNLTAGELGLGCNNRTRGWLDIGSNSALRTLAITNILLLGSGDGRIGYMPTATSMVDYLPPGLTVEIGKPSATAIARFASRPPAQYNLYGEVYPCMGVLRLTNGVFRGWFKELALAQRPQTTAEACTGMLDLATAQVEAFNVSGHVYIARTIGTTYSGTEANSQGGYGYLILPACDANMASNLYVGDTNAPCLGYLELNGTRLRLAGKLEVETTGVVTSYVDGVSGGIDLLSAVATNCAIKGRVHVRFRLPPVEGGYYWGLRMAGDQRATFESFVTAGKLSWSAANGVAASRIAVWYDQADDKTYVGMPKRSGTLLLIR